MADDTRTTVTDASLCADDGYRLANLDPDVISLQTYFDRLFVINLAHRRDRWDQCVRQFEKFGFCAERFEAYKSPLVIDGKPNGHSGCTASHRALLEIVAYHKWGRVLILEDDFKIRFEDFNQRFDAMVREVPDDWDMLYLGASYAERPVSRVSNHVIRAAGLMTTSSYGVTWRQARKMAPYCTGNTGIDSIYQGFHRESNTYIFQPRLMVQSAGWSDCSEYINEHPEFAMEDETHERMV